MPAILQNYFNSWIFCLFFIPVYQVNAQTSLTDFGSRSLGMGHANVTLADAWAIFNNVGGISGTKQGVVFFSYQQMPSIEGMNTMAVGLLHPFKFGSLGISAIKFGDELFSQHKVSLAFGNKIGFVRLGGSINYNQIRFDEFGAALALSMDLGGVVEVSKYILFGAYISNLTSSSFNNSEHTNLPVQMKVGFAYIPTQKFRFALDLEKDIDQDPLIKAGIEYTIIEKLVLRTGVNSNPLKAFFGFGLVLKSFNVDYAFSQHNYLGFTHQLSVSFNYQKP